MPLNQRARQLPRSVVGRAGPGVAQLGVSRRGRRFVVCASRSVWCKKTPDGGFVSCSSVASHLPARIPTAGSVGAMGSVVPPASGRCGSTSVIRASRPAAVVWRPRKKVGFLDLTTAGLLRFSFCLLFLSFHSSPDPLGVLRGRSADSGFSLNLLYLSSPLCRLSAIYKKS